MLTTVNNYQMKAYIIQIVETCVYVLCVYEGYCYVHGLMHFTLSIGLGSAA